jgi:hypothetical protein
VAKRYRKHGTTKKTYTYRGKKVTFDRLAKEAKKRGISRNALCNRIQWGWGTREAVEWPLGKIRSRMRGRNAKGPQATAPLQVPCSVKHCLAAPGRQCRLMDRSCRGHPHLARQRLAKGEDVHKVPPDWRERRAMVRCERLEEFDRVADLQAKVQAFVEDGLTQRAAARLLGITENEVHTLINGMEHWREPSVLEYVPRTLLRPTTCRTGDGESYLAGSYEPCGGGWRIGRSPREDPGHVGR